MVLKYPDLPEDEIVKYIDLISLEIVIFCILNIIMGKEVGQQ